MNDTKYPTESDSLTSSQVIITIMMMLRMSRNNCFVKLKSVQFILFQHNNIL